MRAAASGPASGSLKQRSWPARAPGVRCRSGATRPATPCQLRDTERAVTLQFRGASNRVRSMRRKARSLATSAQRTSRLNSTQSKIWTTPRLLRHTCSVRRSPCPSRIHRPRLAPEESHPVSATNRRIAVHHEVEWMVPSERTGEWRELVKVFGYDRSRRCRRRPACRRTEARCHGGRGSGAGKSLGEVGWSVPRQRGAHRASPRPAVGASALPTQWGVRPPDATAVWGLDDGHHIQIDAVSQAAVESHLVQARMVAAGQAGVIDEAGTRPPA